MVLRLYRESTSYIEHIARMESLCGRLGNLKIHKCSDKMR
jgi:hypothetical protein